MGVNRYQSENKNERKFCHFSKSIELLFSGRTSFSAVASKRNLSEVKLEQDCLPISLHNQFYKPELSSLVPCHLHNEII